MFNLFRFEIVLGVVSFATAGLASVVQNAMTVAVPEGGAWLSDFFQLGALAVVLILVLSYVFKSLVPKILEGGEERLKDQQTAFQSSLEVLKHEIEVQRREREQQRDDFAKVVDVLRDDFRATLDKIADRFQITLDKIAQENREVWQQERERFAGSYDKLSTQIGVLCDTVCTALDEIKDHTAPRMPRSGSGKS